ncbi:site-specific integrase [Asticcacaulis sp. 201]|uniref:tyrosine-type recombinase/integrase n=1 Tax=Asticcacaulis sp. 201 TaxID=3028787 RepID=UPI002915F2AE|nr:site-specific integrase [Asticcacaulis sp. 201]MDV6333155.1 site-specific integrase [Asticcacaulis sp. 201]
MRGDADYGLTLFDGLGRRKYLSLDERLRFLKESERADKETCLFCMVLAFTGCRISEALELTPQQLDAGTLSIVFRTLKRRKLIFRAVPVPSRLMRELVGHCSAMQREVAIWPWCRQTAWRRVKDVMAAAEVRGPQANPKGLRHGFGVANAEKNIPGAITQRWMGHARLETTSIYQQAVGQEERRFAKRLWHDYARP